MTIITELDDKHIRSISPLIKPIDLIHQLPLPNPDIVLNSRNEINKILQKTSTKKLVIVGPCSIHDTTSALEYATMLKNHLHLWPDLHIVCRTYFEKPRSVIGWKGLIYDPFLDNSCDINSGFKIARWFIK